MKRFERVLNIIFRDFIIDPISLEPVKIEYTIDDIFHIFKDRDMRVTYLEVTNILGLELPERVELHNPRTDLDDAVRESWNLYGKDTTETMIFKSANNRVINKLPFAVLAMHLAKLGEESNRKSFKRMKVLGDDGEEVIKMKDNEYKVIGINDKDKDDIAKVHSKIYKGTIKNYNDQSQ